MELNKSIIVLRILSFSSRAYFPGLTFSFVAFFQLYLSVRYGRPASEGILAEILSAVERAREFSAKLREFLAEVTRCGLQDQVRAEQDCSIARCPPLAIFYFKNPF